jgi:hypothetical protein
MSRAIWVYRRTEPGQVRPVSRAAFDAFSMRGGPLKPDADGFVLTPS